MSPEILSAVIGAVVGGLLSFIASVYTNKRITNMELQKLRTEIQQTYAGKLLEKRLDAYPSLYRELSSFIKVIEFGTISGEALKELQSTVEEWDSQYSILFSGLTADLVHELRMLLAGFIKTTNEDLSLRLASKGERTMLRHRIAEVELALKGDLGIYIIEFPDVSKRSFHSYEEIENLLKQRQA